MVKGNNSTCKRQKVASTLKLVVLSLIVGGVIFSRFQQPPPSPPERDDAVLLLEQHPKQPAPTRQLDFYEIGQSTWTDKTQGPNELIKCLADPTKCRKPTAVTPQCRTGAAHYYHTLYNARLGPFHNKENSFQLVEIGFYRGAGRKAYELFLPRAEIHSLEISCLPEGPVNQGKWPWGNSASKSPDYQRLLDTKRLHCGDASRFDFLDAVYQTHLKRPGAPPLKVVIDDASHLAQHMAISLFYWFPRIEPGGLFIVEDVQPLPPANKFRLHVLPQLMKDLHYCGDDTDLKDTACFPTIQKFMQSIHCEMHICVIERNNVPSEDLDKQQSTPPPHTFDAAKCLFGTSP